MYKINKKNYINLNKGGKELIGGYTKNNLTQRTSSYSKEEIDYINKHVKYLVHWTTANNFKKIMKDMVIKSESLLENNIRDNKWQYDHVVFASIITVNNQNNLTLFSDTSAGNNNHKIGILIKKNILYSDDVYYYYSPTGDTCFIHNSIPNNNIKKIIRNEYIEDAKEYILQLSINDNLKNALMLFSGITDEHPHPCGNFFQMSHTSSQLQINFERELHPEHEVCFIDRIDLHKYLAGVDFTCAGKKYNKIKKLIPKNIIIQNNHDVFNMCEFKD
jgi:hypothetical protein